MGAQLAVQLRATKATQATHASNKSKNQRNNAIEVPRKHVEAHPHLMHRNKICKYLFHSSRNKIMLLTPSVCSDLSVKMKKQQRMDDIGLLEACSATNELTWINCAICKVNLTARCNFPARFHSGCLGSVVLVLNLAADSTFPTNHKIQMYVRNLMPHLELVKRNNFQN